MADQIVEVPGVGPVAFPDTMSDADITKAIRTQILPQAQGAKPKPVGAAMAVQSPPISEAPQLSPGPRTSQMPDQPDSRSWLDVGKNSLRNFLPDFAKVGMETVSPIVSPVQTANGLADLATAAVSKVGRMMLRPHMNEKQAAVVQGQAQRAEAPINALVDYYVNKYGSLEGFKNAISDEPAHVLMDVATLGSAGSMAPGKAGQFSSIVSKVDPMYQTYNTLRLGATGAAKVGAGTLGMTTGAGATSIRTAGRTGREYGSGIGKDQQIINNKNTLVDNMNKGAPVEDVVSRAKGALAELYNERGSQYREHMAKIGKDPEVVPFDSIDEAVGKAQAVGTYKGQVVEPEAVDVTAKMAKTVADWKALDPTEFHTIEGLDALKRTLGNIRDATPERTPQRVAADRIYNSVVKVITEQAPEYAKYMGDYGRATDNIKEASRTFSLGERATGDTAARKLLSATRDNVQTNYGGRQRILDLLAEQDPTLPAAIAGQALHSWEPRGLVGRGGLVASVIANPSNALLAPAFSPRVVGNAVYLGGRLIGTVEDAARALGVTAESIRAAELAGYQAGNSNAIADRAKSLRDLNAVGAR